MKYLRSGWVKGEALWILNVNRYSNPFHWILVHQLVKFFLVAFLMLTVCFIFAKHSWIWPYTTSALKFKFTVGVKLLPTPRFDLSDFKFVKRGRNDEMFVFIIHKFHDQKFPRKKSSYFRFFNWNSKRDTPALTSFASKSIKFYDFSCIYIGNFCSLSSCTESD